MTVFWRLFVELLLYLPYVHLEKIVENVKNAKMQNVMQLRKHIRRPQYAHADTRDALMSHFQSENHMHTARHTTTKQLKILVPVRDKRTSVSRNYYFCGVCLDLMCPAAALLRTATIFMYSCVGYRKNIKPS